jgi:tripartite-type tricarboxylate transporter receptor subunit TctC
MPNPLAGRVRACAAALLPVLACLAAAPAQAWPERQITIVVPFPAGGLTDVAARHYAQGLQEELKQPVVVENRVGAGGIIGTEFVAKAKPDGYTLLVNSPSHVINQAFRAKMPYDALRDFTPIAQLLNSPMVLVVHPSVPANNVKELVALSKQKDLNFAVSGTGGAPHLAGVALAQAVGARWQYVPYKGGSQAITDTVGGQTQVMMNGMLATYPHVQSGKLKLLAVSKRTRMPLIADVPTIAEQGVPGFESGSWQGVLVAKGTPDAIVQRLNAELVRAIRSPDVRARLAGQGAEVVTMTPQEQDQFFATERKRWGQVVASANIKAE